MRKYRFDGVCSNGTMQLDTPMEREIRHVYTSALHIFHLLSFIVTHLNILVFVVYRMIFVYEGARLSYSRGVAYLTCINYSS